MTASTADRADGFERRAFVARLLAPLPDALVVTGLGSSTYDVFAAGDRPTNYYLWGAMGGAVPLALGLALARPDDAVIALTGDGEALMGLGALATVAVHRPVNLTVVVLDNAHYGETGMQPSHTGLGTRLAEVARACGIADATEVRTLDAADAIARRVAARAGPAFAQVHVRSDALPRALPPRDGAFLKNRFRAALGIAPL